MGLKTLLIFFLVSKIALASQLEIIFDRSDTQSNYLNTDLHFENIYFNFFHLKTNDNLISSGGIVGYENSKDLGLIYGVEFEGGQINSQSLKEFILSPRLGYGFKKWSFDITFGLHNLRIPRNDYKPETSSRFTSYKLQLNLNKIFNQFDFGVSYKNYVYSKLLNDFDNSKLSGQVSENTYTSITSLEKNEIGFSLGYQLDSFDLDYSFKKSIYLYDSNEVKSHTITLTYYFFDEYKGLLILGKSLGQDYESRHLGLGIGYAF